MKESYVVSLIPQSTTGLARAVFLCSLRNGQVGTALGKFLINLNDSEVKNQAPSFLIVNFKRFSRLYFYRGML